jgi:DNA-binding GntR family transcriptional regulator
MLASNQQMLCTVFPFFAEEPPVICDWLPWNHTFGGSHNFGLVLYNGGSMYLDAGRPLEGAFDATVANLHEIAPTVYFNVPKGFEMLAPHLRRSAELRERFFSRLRMMFYAGAGLSQHVWDELDRLSLETRGGRIPMLTGLGATETAPFAMCASAENTTAGVVGLPVPGVSLKLAPVGGKLEARFRGPNVTPGYWRQPELTAAAFDDEGYYRMGDGLRFLDPADAGRGFLFDGRLSEDFKLSTGTWVSVGPLRTRFLLHAAPLVRDVAIAGHDRGEVTALIFPDPAQYRRLESTGGARAALEKLLASFGALNPGSSMRIERAIVLEDAPSFDAGEWTEKGTVNQGAVLRRRADVVERLYRTPYAADVIRAAAVAEAPSQIERVAATLREKVLRGEFRPGERLAELTLVPRLNASRTPVRLALERLAHQGLLEPQANGGFRVREFTISDIWDAIELRGVLEGTAARMAAERLSDRVELERLRRCHEAFAAVAPMQMDDFLDYVAKNLAYHRELWKLAKSPTLERALEIACALPFAEPGALVFGGSEDAGQYHAHSAAIAIEHHRAILEAIENRESARAEAIAREHSRLARNNLDWALRNRELLQQVPGGMLIALTEARQAQSGRRKRAR